MGITRLRIYQVTCDGKVELREAWGEAVIDSCDAVIEVRAENRNEVLRSLPGGWKSMIGPGGPFIRCPKEHVY